MNQTNPPISPTVAEVRPFVPPIDDDTMVVDLARSQGPRLYDTPTGRFYIDFASSYASVPLGYNHPGFHEPDYEARLLEVGRTKIANLDMLTEHYRRFLATFRRVVGVPGWTHYFFVEGGALAVENTMKTAFDWKVRKNIAAGRGEIGTQILHFKQAFHGRSGYTMTVTNSPDPNKTLYFPTFDWPRVSNPMASFPLEGQNLAATIAREDVAKKEIEAAIAQRGHNIAAILIEPVQGEGGDNHFRREFFQYLRDITMKHDMLLIFDEVQAGMCISGKPWMFQTFGVEPDMVAFGKKSQACGFIGGPRIDEVEQNVFRVPSRISSTWGGNIVDMVRCTQYLEIIEREKILDNVVARGAQLTASLHRVEAQTGAITNIRGRGLMIAFDLVEPGLRSQLVKKMEHNGLLVLPCGTKSVRFRPHLNITADVCDEAIAILESTLAEVLASVRAPVAATT